MGRTSTVVNFPGSSGAALAARLDLPLERAPRAYALLAHCFTCSKDTKATAFIAGALADAGIATLRFDFTGLGGSDGEFANTDFSSNVSDLVAAARWLEQHHRAPALLVGHSLGGAAVLAAAAQIPSATAVATINAPSDPAHVLAQFAGREAEIEARGEAEVDLGGRHFRVKRKFLEDITGQKLAGALTGLGRALLVMHTPRDTVVSIDHASALFLGAKHPKSFVSLDDADHLLTRREDARYAATVLAAWASRYLPVGPTETPSAEIMRDSVVVTETREGKLQQAIVAGPHRLLADEPIALGGLDSGPTPYDLLLAALGACTAMTVRMYADLKHLPLERVSVTLRHDKVHATDCAECETKEGRIDKIERIVALEGDLDDAAKAKLLEIANKCPVHRTLRSEVWVPTRLS
ncbi:MAG: alpha/beta fold hydrolase [Betaproteobacteria bacterium]|nr:alpha/beta fold hydrolase [Betaproteobacteria bacterium]MBA3774908.1 alpha/beta fold hydrolase [Betaproteobacteria bacterium]